MSWLPEPNVESKLVTASSSKKKCNDTNCQLRTVNSCNLCGIKLCKKHMYDVCKLCVFQLWRLLLIVLITELEWKYINLNVYWLYWDKHWWHFMKEMNGIVWNKLFENDSFSILSKEIKSDRLWLFIKIFFETDKEEHSVLWYMFWTSLVKLD